MPELIPPHPRLHAAWLEAHAEWGPGPHEDGFGLDAADNVESSQGFGAWLERLEADRQCIYRWIVEGEAVLGGIALRAGPDDYVSWAGNVGYGIRPSARRRGAASWALKSILSDARALGMRRALVVCAVDNTASARTIESCGGVLEGTSATTFGAVLRYWIEIM